jgi:hypothetical protein|tara:strand:- start:8 stop:532 length:525 start_codon:yes stop_codon:yes gene_type:complete
MSNDEFLKTNFNYNNKYNGRVNIMSQPPNPLFLQDKIVSNSNTFHNSLNGIQETSNLSNTFFSRENIRIIQNAIRRGIYDKSNGKFIIGEQDNDTLNIIMRSIYLQNSTNLETNIAKQIMSLNNLVINYAINQIYGEVNGYMKYKNDISTLAVPLNLPIYANKTSNTLELKPFF